MSDCTCPDDGREVDRDNRVYVYGPKADVTIMTQQGPQRQLDASQVHIFHKDCPQHGYEVLNDEQ